MEIEKYYQNEQRFNGFFSRDNLPERSSTEIKDEAYIINLDEYYGIGSHWVALHVNNNGVTFSIVLEYKIFHKKLNYLLTIKTLKQTFLEYKHTIQ